MVASDVYSEDIELYVGNKSTSSDNRPKVLLIVDTSGSMGDDETIKTPYIYNRSYKTQGTFNGTGTSYIYYTKGSGNTVLPSVDSLDEKRRFIAEINGCKTALEKLNTIGFYTGRIRQYEFDGNTGSWQGLSNTSAQGIRLIDCEDDTAIDLDNIADDTAITHNENKKALVDGSLTATLPNGYPVNGMGTEENPVYYTNIPSNSDADWSGEVVTLYLDNYLRWDQGEKYANNTNIGQVTQERIEIAKTTLVNLINSVPSVDFGLQVYNSNGGSDSTQSNAHGGRIAFAIQDMTQSAKGRLVSMIENQVHPSGSTPLCESLWEAAQYIGGKAIDYGNNDVDRASSYGKGYTHYKDKPGMDPDASTAGIYDHPYGACSNEAFMILITDGVPTNDTAADGNIKGVTELTNFDGSSNLTELARYMHTQDINDNLSGKQTATLFTVGFSSGSSGATSMLRNAAEAGGGEYYDATDPTKLGAALQQAITSILAINTTFTAPSVASNSFDRTETLSAAYYAMFIPGKGARWRGNLKKLEVVNKVQVDQNGDAALDATGNFKNTAKTIWSNTVDGGDVRKGGVVDTLTARTADRVIFSDIGLKIDGTTKILARLTLSSAVDFFNKPGAVPADLAEELGVPADDVEDYFNWALGQDVDDEDDDNNRTENRTDTFGDPLHSKPLVINYGNATDSENPDIRIIIGTNSGALHMFKDSGDTVSESWAFMPKEFFDKIKVLKDNLPTSSKEYAIDGPATVHLFDSDGNGSIDKDTSDKAWIFFGLRRGGSSYYALDVTKPDAPKLLWHIDADTSGFGHLGQSWSRPKIAYSALNIHDKVPKPVLIFGAGYDISKDSSGVPGVDHVDTVGRGVYMIDAETGTLLWSLTPDATSSSTKNTQFLGITDSIPSSIAVLDSDADGLVDRLYMGDTGGNIWRVDMPKSNPFSATSPWTVFQIAELGGLTELEDRRFFDEPSIVRTFITDTFETDLLDADGKSTGESIVVQQERPYDAILIGSGDRTSPTDIFTRDKFFMIKDGNIITESYIVGAAPPAAVIPENPIFKDDLHNFTNNPFGPYTLPIAEADKAALLSLELDVSGASGWYYDYLTDGEKSTASAIVINGVAYFSSFTPGAGGTCSLVDGVGSLYAIDMYQGRTIYDWRKTFTTTGMRATPTLIVTAEPDTGIPPTIPMPGEDKSTIKLLTGGKVIDLSLSLRTSQNYLYVTEDN